MWLYQMSFFSEICLFFQKKARLQLFTAWRLTAFCDENHVLLRKNKLRELGVFFDLQILMAAVMGMAAQGS